MYKPKVERTFGIEYKNIYTVTIYNSVMFSKTCFLNQSNTTKLNSKYK